MERFLVTVLVLINVCIASGWVHLASYNMKLKRPYYRYYCVLLVAHFITVAFLQWDEYVFHKSPLIWDAFSLRIIACIIALIATFGFVIHTAQYDGKSVDSKG